MSRAQRRSTYWFRIFLAIELALVGNAFTLVAANVVALTSASRDEHSLVGNIINTAMQVGGGVDLAVMSVVATTVLGNEISGEVLLASAYPICYRNAEEQIISAGSGKSGSLNVSFVSQDVHS